MGKSSNANGGKIVRIQTEHSYEMKILFEVLKEILHEIKMDFIRDTNAPNNSTNDDSDDGSNQSSNDSESSESENEKRPTKKSSKVVKKGKNKNDSESESSSSESSEEEKKPTKKQQKNKKVTKKGKKNESESDSSDSDSSEDDKKSKKNGKGKSKDIQKKPSGGGGIRIMAVDNYQTLLIYVKLNSEQFVDFYVKPAIHSVGIDLIQLHRFMKTVDKDSIMNIYIDKDDEQNIGFNLDNTTDSSSADYKQKLLDIDDNTKKLPQETNFEMTVAMDTANFKKICAEMSNFSEYVEIECTSKEITFRCQGDSNHYVKTFKNSDTGVRITSLNNGKGLNMVQAIYNLKHLVTFGKCTNLCTEMQLFLKNDYPLFINYTIGLLGKMLVGLSPIDEKTIKRENDYDDNTDKYYANKKVTMKNL